MGSLLEIPKTGQSEEEREGKQTPGFKELALEATGNNAT